MLNRLSGSYGDTGKKFIGGGGGGGCEIYMAIIKEYIASSYCGAGWVSSREEGGVQGNFSFKLEFPPN